MTQGWIKLHRTILDSSIWQNPNAMQVWLYLLLRARHTEGRFPFNGKDMELKAGELISSHDSIELGLKRTLSTSQIRTALKYLISTSRITVKTTNKFSIISICNWDSYQADDRQDDKPIADESQTNDKPIATNKKGKKEKEGSEGKEVLPASGETTFPSELDNPECRTQWDRWLTHKQARRETYKTLDSQEAQLRRCAKMCQTPERFKAAIEFSISQNYSGIFEEQKKQTNKQDARGVAENGYSHSFNHNMDMIRKYEEEEAREREQKRSS